jgi:uncharacterized damage-inducible protein DinB
MSKRNLSSELDLLLRIIDEGFEKKAWHGPNLRGSIRGLTAHQAAWRPAPGRHNIWEIVVHAAYWKYAVRRRILGEKRGSFPVKGSNWFRRPLNPDEQAWREDVELLVRQHQEMRAAIEGIGSRLNTTRPGSRTSNATLIYGIAAHDVYHAGQIQVLKRLQRT